MPRVKISPDGQHVAIYKPHNSLYPGFPWSADENKRRSNTEVKDWTELVPEQSPNVADARAAMTRVMENVSDPRLNRQIITYAFATKYASVARVLEELAEAGRNGTIADYSIRGFAAELMMVLNGDME